MEYLKLLRREARREEKNTSSQAQFLELLVSQNPRKTEFVQNKETCLFPFNGNTKKTQNLSNTCSCGL